MAVERKIPFALLRNAQTAIFSAVMTVMLVYFLLASGDLFLRKAIRLIPRLRDKIRAVEIARKLRIDIGRYFMTATAINALLDSVGGMLIAVPLLVGLRICAENIPALASVAEVLARD